MCSYVYFNVLAKNFHCLIVNKNCQVDILDHDHNVGMAAILDFWQKNCQLHANVNYNFFVQSYIIKIPNVIVI